jgi:hypothetical protein
MSKPDLEPKYYSTHETIEAIRLQGAEGPQNLIFTKKLDSIGDGSGSVNQNVNGAETPVVFKMKPEAGQIMLVHHINILVRDNPSFDSGGWGALANTPLTNGCVLGKILDGSHSDAFNLKSNADMAGICYDITHHSFDPGDEFVVARFSFRKLGAPIRLIGDNNDELNFTINDDLTALVDQYVVAEGEFENQSY